MKHLSLFNGIGGFQLAAKLPKWYSETFEEQSPMPKECSDYEHIY